MPSLSDWVAAGLMMLCVCGVIGSLALLIILLEGLF